MRQQSDYSIIFLRLLFITVCAVGALTIYWMVAAEFPNISIWGWIVVSAYMIIAFVVPTVITPLVSRVANLSNYIAWKIVMAVWVSSTAIAGLLAWPIIGPHIRPLFFGSS